KFVSNALASKLHACSVSLSINRTFPGGSPLGGAVRKSKTNVMLRKPAISAAARHRCGGSGSIGGGGCCGSDSLGGGGPDSPAKLGRASARTARSAAAANNRRCLRHMQRLLPQNAARTLNQKESPSRRLRTSNSGSHFASNAQSPPP